MSQHHDPVHPDSDHLTAEVLADLDLGLLDAASAAHAEQHLTHCGACSQLRDDLASLTGALSDLPPVPMPDDVWEQLRSTLAAEPVVTPAGAATVVPIDEARRRRWGRPGIGVVAGAAGIALLGAIVVPMLMTAGAGDSSSGDGGIMAGADSNKDARQVPPMAYLASSTGTSYDKEELDQQVDKLVARRADFTATATLPDDPVASPSPSSLDSSPEATPSGTATQAPEVGATSVRLADGPAAAEACLASYLGVSGIAPLAIDIGTWDGEPAAVIVLPDEEPDLAQVWVIDPDCSGPDDPLIYYATVSR